MKTLIPLFVFLSGYSFAQCKEKSHSFAFFNNKTSSWMQELKMVHLQCGESEFLAVTQGKGAELNRVKLTPADGHLKWQWDGTTCLEEAERKNKTHIFRNKYVLAPVTESESAALSPKEVWAVNQKTKRLEKILPAGLVCNTSEP